MESLRLTLHLRRWALSLSLALVTALTFHCARVYPWHRLYLVKSTTSLLEHLPAEPISQQGPCFLPGDAASRSPGTTNVVPIGSFDATGLDRHRCFQYSSRFEPYAAQAWGNTYITRAQERLGLQDEARITGDLIWYANLLAENEPHAYPYTEWSNRSLSKACRTAQDATSLTTVTNTHVNKPRLAFVLRCYQNFVWTQDAILHLRAIIWELRSIALPFDVDVHLLLEVKDATSYASMFTNSGRRQILRGSVPIEFWSMVTLWSENEMVLRYPLYGDFRAGIHAAGSYRGCLLPLQRFAVQHPEYGIFVNWEMDTRFTHTYDHLLQSIQTYAYQAGAQTYTQWPVHGANLDKQGNTDGACKNKSADVVVFSPVRNPHNSGWYWEYDVQGYPAMLSTPRAASVGTNLWLSRRALLALENVTADHHQSLFCEAMAPSLVFRSTAIPIEVGDDQCVEQLKLVHYPHPVAFKYQASPAQVDQLLNPTSSVLSKHNEEVLKDTSYYYASTIASQIYGQWQSQAGACIAPLVLHPIKSPVTNPDLSRRSSFFKSWFGASNTLSLCAASTLERCAQNVQADIERYVGRKLDTLGQRSLFRWDLERLQYISKRTWIMNSSTRSLVYTVVILILIASIYRFVADCHTATTWKRGRSEYIPLASD